MGWTQETAGFWFAIKENIYWDLRHYEFTSKKKKWWKLHCLGVTREKTKFEWEGRDIRWHHDIWHSRPFQGGFSTSLLETGLTLRSPCASGTRCWSRLGHWSFWSHPLTALVPLPWLAPSNFMLILSLPRAYRDSVTVPLCHGLQPENIDYSQWKLTI